MALKAQNSAGFSLIELLIALAVLGTILGLGVPISSSAYRNFLLGAEIEKFVILARRAEGLSTAGYREKDHGLAVQSGNLTVFEGASFAARNPDFDESYNLSDSIQISGPSEITFQLLSGRPFASSSWTISLDSGAGKIVSINEEGAVSW